MSQAKAGPHSVRETSFWFASDGFGHKCEG